MTKNIPDAQNVHALILMLGDDDWKVRQQAITKLKDYHETDMTQELVELMRKNHHNPNLLNALVQTFTTSIIDPLPALIQCLNDPDSDLRIYTVLTLGERKDPRAIAPLLKMLDDPNPNVRFQAIEALGNLKATESIDKLIEIAQSEDFYLSFAALDTLINIKDSGITPHLIPLIKNTSDWRLKREAIETVAKNLDSDSISDLIQLFRKHYQNPAILDSIMQVLSMTEFDCLPLLRECLQDTSPDLRSYTVSILGKRQDERAVPDLLKMLDDSDSNVVFHAIKALSTLAQTGDNTAVKSLFKLLSHGDPKIRSGAIAALNSIGQPDMSEHILALMNDENEYVRESSVKLAGYFAAPECIERIFSLANDPAQRVRQAVIESIAYVDDERVLPTLNRALNQDTPWVRVAAVCSLGNLDELKVLPCLINALSDEYHWVRYYALCGINKFTYAQVKENLEPESYLSLQTKLKELIDIDAAYPVRVLAIEVLGMIAQESALDFLSLLSDNDNEYIARAALKAIASMKTTSSMTLLQEIQVLDKLPFRI